MHPLACVIPVLITLLIKIEISVQQQQQPDSICRIIHRHGYDCQMHIIQTMDGYQLTLHRIPKNGTCLQQERHEQRRRLPFVLMHGLFGSAGDFVVAGRRSGIAYLLHEHCYDVWLPNCRGTTFSRSHRQFNISMAAFWNFSWHEIGIYDLPAIVDYVLSSTNHNQLHYVAHSQGATVFLVLLSERPAYNTRFASTSLLAPVAFLKHLRSPPLRLLASDSRALTLLLNQLGLHELLPSNALSQVGGTLLCSSALPTFSLCSLLTSLYVGFSDYPLDRVGTLARTEWNGLGEGDMGIGSYEEKTIIETHFWVLFCSGLFFPFFNNLFPRILMTTPAGISRKQLQHYEQLINSGEFQHFDYKSESENYRHYGRPTPPGYNLRNVRVSLQIFYGNRDSLSTPEDIQRLSQELTQAQVSLIQLSGYNHIDMLYSDSAARLIYQRIINKVSRTQY